MTWREMFLSLQIEVEETIGRHQREAVERINATQDSAALGMRRMASGE